VKGKKKYQFQLFVTWMAWMMGDPSIPPQFACDDCGGAMYPERYKGVHGYEYRIMDRLGKEEVEG
jgi:hypothetical protein